MKEKKMMATITTERTGKETGRGEQEEKGQGQSCVILTGKGDGERHAGAWTYGHAGAWCR